MSWLKKYCHTTWHTTSTCSMLPRDKGGVVNPQLRVYGTQNIRVADLSIIPLSPCCHTQSVAYTIGEIGKFIRQRPDGWEAHVGRHASPRAQRRISLRAFSDKLTLDWNVPRFRSLCKEYDRGPLVAHGGVAPCIYTTTWLRYLHMVLSSRVRRLFSEASMCCL